MAMTAADHFDKAEGLLEDADKYSGDERRGEWVTRAQAHFTAARLLLDIEQLMTSDLRAARRTGLEQIVQKRRASNDI